MLHNLFTFTPAVTDAIGYGNVDCVRQGLCQVDDMGGKCTGALVLPQIERGWHIERANVSGQKMRINMGRMHRKTGSARKRLCEASAGSSNVRRLRPAHSQIHNMGCCESILDLRAFGSSINLNLHSHIIFLEGVYLDRRAGLKPRFVKADPPSNVDISAVL